MPAIRCRHEGCNFAVRTAAESNLNDSSERVNGLITNLIAQFSFHAILANQSLFQETLNNVPIEERKGHFVIPEFFLETPSDERFKGKDVVVIPVIPNR